MRSSDSGSVCMSSVTMVTCFNASDLFLLFCAAGLSFYHVYLQSAGRDAETLKQILDRLAPLQHPTSRTSEPSRHLSPLKALTEQLRRGNAGTRTRAGTALPCPPLDLTNRVNVMLKELQDLNRKMNSSMQLLQLYVTFLRTAEQVRVQTLEPLGPTKPVEPAGLFTQTHLCLF